MNEQVRSFALVVAGLAFVAFLLSKLLRRAERRVALDAETGKRLADARRRALDRSLASEARAEALREAATLALEGGRPNLAASYARRAERIEPNSADSIGLIATALRRATRFRALERLLWRRLAHDDPRAGTYIRAREELALLYEQTRRPEIALALRRLGQHNE